MSVSIAPQRYLVERIGGEHVQVNVMLQPGNSPETFDPTARQIGVHARSRIYFRIGVPFEMKWLESLVDGNSQLKIIDCCESILKPGSISLDNHVWTSARNIQLLARLVKTELTAIEPDHAFEFEKNYLGLIRELEQLDSEIYSMLEQRRTDYFIISHPALGHFADDYGLIQIALEQEGRQPGPKSLVKMIRQARAENIRTLFVQKQHPSAAALAFANEIGAELVELDPLHGDYINNLRNITGHIARATR